MQFMVFNIVVALSLIYLFSGSNPIVAGNNAVDEVATLINEKLDKNSLDQSMQANIPDTEVIDVSVAESQPVDIPESVHVSKKIEQEDQALPPMPEPLEVSSTPVVEPIFDDKLETQNSNIINQLDNQHGSVAAVELMTPSQRARELSRLVDELQLFAAHTMDN